MSLQTTNLQTIDFYFRILEIFWHGCWHLAAANSKPAALGMAAKTREERMSNENGGNEGNDGKKNFKTATAVALGIVIGLGVLIGGFVAYEKIRHEVFMQTMR